MASTRAPDRDGAVGFIGLGAMGGGMAAALVHKGFEVRGFDVFEPAMAKLREAGGGTAATCAEAAMGASVVVVMVTTASQAESALFGMDGAVQGMADGAVVVLCSTVPPGFARTLRQRLADVGRSIDLVDAPVSGGVARAAAGTLTIMAAGTSEALEKADKVLRAMSEKLYRVDTSAGAGSAVKMVNQLLAGVHIAAAAEAMALGARAGLDTRMLYDIISHAAGNSWMFENRVPHMLDDDYVPPRSALNIFVKDLGIVLGEAQTMGFPLPLAAAAHQQFLAGAAAGLGREDDAAVVKVYEKLSGVCVSKPLSSSSTLATAVPKSSSQHGEAGGRISKRLLLASLPPEWPGAAAEPATAAAAAAAVGGKREVSEESLEVPAAGGLRDVSGATGESSISNSSSSLSLLVVLDDDPTGTQTVHGLPVLTTWEVPVLREEIRRGTSAFFILTNSRALPTNEAVELTTDICRNVVSAAEAEGIVCSSQVDGEANHSIDHGDGSGSSARSIRGLSVILRGDSTLRGHFPQEVEAAAAVVGPVDAWVLCPFFLEGGRYTVNDTHYVADGEDDLVPAAETEFARDAAFGYTKSDLKQWVEEKTGGRIPAQQVASISIHTIRTGGPSAVTKQLLSLKRGSSTVCIVNAASDSDLATVAAGIVGAENEGMRILCRTAASFVSARLGIKKQPPLTPADFAERDVGSGGGLIVVGSYVPKTTAQVDCLLQQLGGSLRVFKVDVADVSSATDDSKVEALLQRVAKEADESLQQGVDTVVMTSRELLTGQDAESSLAIGQRISNALVRIVSAIRTRPKYVLAKGGITSSEMATRALQVDRAMVAGQAMPGVPLWCLGPSSRFPGLPYIVFPGNVGGPDALAKVVKLWQQGTQQHTRTITPSSASLRLLKAAEEAGYAVGAFNVYNLEGVRAVVAAAEAEESPAIIQLHPAALARGGPPLVAACHSAATAAKVPIAVHLDHATSEEAIASAMAQGFDSVMVDGSAQMYAENIALTQRVVAAAQAKGVAVEAELGRIAGVEDGESVADCSAKMTDVAQADEFMQETGVHALAVCVGNRHGPYPAAQLASPTTILDLERLQALQQAANRRGVFLVLHGASGLPDSVVTECIRKGVRKFNVNTEVRAAFMESLQSSGSGGKDLVEVMAAAEAAMTDVIRAKMRLFGSAGQARK